MKKESMGARRARRARSPKERSRQAREAAHQRWRNQRLAAFMSLLKSQRLLAQARLSRS